LEALLAAAGAPDARGFLLVEELVGVLTGGDDGGAELPGGDDGGAE
jgi:hypothetical protein